MKPVFMAKRSSAVSMQLSCNEQRPRLHSNGSFALLGYVGSLALQSGKSGHGTEKLNRVMSPVHARTCIWSVTSSYSLRQAVLEAGPNARGSRCRNLRLRHRSPSIANNYAVFLQVLHGTQLVEILWYPAAEGCCRSSFRSYHNRALSTDHCGLTDPSSSKLLCAIFGHCSFVC